MQCDMVMDGGGWTRFNWVKAAFPDRTRSAGQTLDRGAIRPGTCAARRFPMAARDGAAGQDVVEPEPVRGVEVYGGQHDQRGRCWGRC